MQFTGAFTALVTPFRDGHIDEEAYRAHIEWQIEQGIDGLVPCGTTGESATLTHDEHHDVIRICIEQAKGRVPVIAGAGSNNTHEAIGLTQFAKDIGADAALHITPYYNKPTQEGLYQHYKTIANAVDLPIFVYNVPGRTGINISPETLARLNRDVSNIVGVKEATANLIQASEIMEYCGMNFQMLSGDDFTVLPMLSIGCCGVISVTSNVAPAKMAGLCRAYRENDLATAQRLHFELSPLNRAMFLESNPIPVKTALSMMGRMTLEMRLPLCPLQQQNQHRLRDILAASGLV
ncbi:MAG: 4-hydroxy-tetrahydrodipicolinate synthase [Pseudomonadota bacterium]